MGGEPRRARPAADSSLVAQVRDYAIIGLDPSGVIQSWNAGAEAVKGYTAEEIVGRHFSCFYPAADRRSGLPLRLLDEARAVGRVEHVGWRVRKDGSRFWGDVVITALRDDDNQLTGFVKVTRDLTQQHELEEALRSSEERFRLLVSQVVDYAIIALDPHGVIETWNDGAQAVKGYAAEEVIGQHFSVFYPEEDRRSGLPLRLLDEARALGRVEHQGWRVRKDGTKFWGDVVITAIHDETGRLTGFGKVTRDLTEQRRMEQARDSFFASLSHDLRTPLTAVKGFAGLLEGAEGEQQHDIVRRIVANVDRMAQLVTDLIDHAKLKSAPAGAEFGAVSLPSVVAETLQNVGSLLNGHQVVVRDEAVEVDGDAGMIERALGNLLANAAKYSPKGSTITVTVDVRDDHARLIVSDEGRGIAADDLTAIFEEFQRGSLAEADGGTGLGLASVREVVTRHHGEVWIESEVGQGTRVIMDLPVHREPGSSRPINPRRQDVQSAG